MDNFEWCITNQPTLYQRLSNYLRSDGFVGKVSVYTALLTAIGKVDVIFDRFLRGYPNASTVLICRFRNLLRLSLAKIFEQGGKKDHFDHFQRCCDVLLGHSDIQQLFRTPCDDSLSVLSWTISCALASQGIRGHVNEAFSHVAHRFPPKGRWCYLLDLTEYLGSVHKHPFLVFHDLDLSRHPGADFVEPVKTFTDGSGSVSTLHLSWSSARSSLLSPPPTPGRSLSPRTLFGKENVAPSDDNTVDSAQPAAKILVEAMVEAPIVDIIDLTDDVNMAELADMANEAEPADMAEVAPMEIAEVVDDVPAGDIIDLTDDVTMAEAPLDDGAAQVADVEIVAVRPRIHIISDEDLNIPTIIFITFQPDGSVKRGIAVDHNPLTPNCIPRVWPSIMDVVSVDAAARVRALWKDFAQFRWQYYNYERNIHDCISDLVVARYADKTPGQFPTRPDGLTNSEWTGVRFWLVIWWLYAYPSTFILKNALACLGQNSRNRLFTSVVKWALHYGPGHFEWYCPYTWLDHKFRAPFNLIGPGDYARLRIPRNLYLLTQHRLLANSLGDRNASREAVIAHQT